MGMSASQARLLSITSRMNDVEFKSQQISNTKIRLADESEQVANDYTKALNKQKFTYTDYSSGSAVKVDLNSSTLANYGLTLVPRNATPQYRVVNQVGMVKNSFNNAFEAQNYLLQNNFTKVENVEFKGSVANTGFVTGNKVTDNRFKNAGIESSAFNRVSLNDELVFSNFRNNQNETLKVVEYYPSVPETFSASDLYEMIESGQFYLKGYSTITTADGVTKPVSGEISVTANTNMAIESDTTELAKAEADYNAKTAKINRKEKLLDNDLKALDTEHSALNTEMDSIKSLIKDNVDKTFNLFS